MQSPSTKGNPSPALIRRAQGGDRAALRELLVSVTPHVKQWALAHTGDPDLAADLCQDTLIQVLRKIDSFRGDAQFLTWLFSVTRRQALEAERRKGRDEKKMTRFKMETGQQSRADPGRPDRVDRDRLGALVDAFVSELPCRQREVFQMADLSGMSSPEIGSVLGISAGAARAALLKARRALRKKILERHPEIVEEFLT